MSVNRIFTTFSVSTSKLLSSLNTFSSQNSNKLSYSDNQAIAHLTDRFRTDIVDKPASLANILNKILQKQPLEKTLKAENEVNQMFVDQARVLYNSGVNIVEGTINMTIDAALSNGGRNPMVLSDPTRPQVDFSGAKVDYQSQMMRRNLEGKINGEGIKRGEFMGLVIKSNLRN